MEEIPVPIPNTEVKLQCAENTCGLPCWKDRLLLVFIYSPLAQLVERSAVKQILQNQEVSRSIRKLVDDKVANSVKLITSNVDDNTEQGESYV